MSDIVNSLSQQLYRDKCRVVERCFVGCVESIEDRVPTNAEVRDYGHRFNDGLLEIYTWKGVEVVRVHYWPQPGMPYEIFSLVNPFPEIQE